MQDWHCCCDTSGIPLANIMPYIVLGLTMLPVCRCCLIRAGTVGYAFGLPLVGLSHGAAILTHMVGLLPATWIPCRGEKQIDRVDGWALD